MPEAKPAAFLKLVRRSLRRDPDASFEQVLAQWRKLRPTELDDETLRTIFAEEVAALKEPRATDPRHGQRVVWTLAGWVAVWLVLALISGLPSYLQCRGSGVTTGAFGGCGMNFGLAFLGLGTAQVLVGLIAAVVVSRFNAAATQGLLIGVAIVFLSFTALCFGATATG